MAVIFATLALATTLIFPKLDVSTITLPTEVGSQGIQMGVAGQTETEDIPKDGTGLRKVTSTKRSITVKILAQLPLEDEEDYDPEIAKTINSEINRVKKDFSRDYGRTMSIEKGGLTVSLTVGTDFAGNVRITESCKAPALYVRSITARESDVAEALQILATLKIRNTSGEWVDMYPSGFPKGWTAPFSDKRVKVPVPRDADKVDSSLGAAYTQSWDEADSHWGVIDYWKEFSGKPTDLSKIGEFYEGKFYGKSTVEKSDVVEWESQKLVRVFGSSQDSKDWVVWYLRNAAGKLGAVYAVRAKGKSWPTSLPLDPSTPGNPLTDSVWPEADSTAVRTVTHSNSSISLRVYGHAQPDKDGTTFFSSPTESYQVMYGEVAAKLANDCDPEKNSQPPRFGAAGIVDAQRLKTPTGYWMVARQLVPSDDPKVPKFRRFEILYTVQDGTPFVIWLVGWDNESFRNAMRETMLSAKDKDGKPLLEKYPYDGAIATDYYGPFWGFKQSLLFKELPMASISSREGFVLPGWTLSGGTVVYFTFDWNKPDYTTYDIKFWPRTGLTRNEKFNRKAFKGIAASGEVQGIEGEWDKDHVRYTTVTVQLRPGALVHFSRVWKSSDKDMLDFLKTLK